MNTIKSNSTKQFLNIGRDLCNGSIGKAKAALMNSILERVNEDVSNAKLVKHLIAEALLNRIDKKLLDSKHIYLQKFEVSQIDMFSKMSKLYPQVAVSHEIANQFLSNQIGDSNSAVLFEIGIGKSLQLAKLVDLLSGHTAPHLKKLHVIGLDPDVDNLIYSENIMKQLNQHTPFEITFAGYHKLLEDFTTADFDQVKSRDCDVFLINAAFSFHHICSHPRTNEVRLKWLKKLKALNPDVFTLIEPNSDHNSDNVIERIKHCYHHFHSVFELIDQSDLEKTYKYAVKIDFFGREIDDIFSKEDRHRVERHETTDDWIYKLTRAGFTPLAFMDVTFELPRYCEVELNEGLVNLGYKEHELITVFAYS